MGRIRKTASIFSFGLIRFRNNRERQIEQQKIANSIAARAAGEPAERDMTLRSLLIKSLRKKG